MTSRPIFIIGPHRSGSTLMRQIIDGHSRIACPPETFFLFEIKKLAESDDFLTGADSLGMEEENRLFAIRRLTDTLYSAYAESKCKPRWADKTPTYVKIIDFIESLYGPYCQYVMLFRHPLDIIHSLVKKGWQLFEYDPNPLINTALYIKDMFERQIAFQQKHPNRCYVVQYETLMHEPSGTLQSLFDFLGEPWEESVLNWNSKPHDFGLGDPDAQFVQGFKPSIGNWKSWSNDDVRQAAEILGPLMDELGYEC